MKNVFFTFILMLDFVFAQKINCTISKDYNNPVLGSFNWFEKDSNSISTWRFKEEKGEERYMIETYSRDSLTMISLTPVPLPVSRHPDIKYKFENLIHKKKQIPAILFVVQLGRKKKKTLFN